MSPPTAGFRYRPSLILILILGILILTAGYLYRQGNSPADVTTLAINGSPGGIVFIADPHLRTSNMNGTQEIIRQINDLHPSVVLIGGDFTYIDDKGSDGLAHQEVWSGIDAPVYAVLGNHDYKSGIGALAILNKTTLVQKASLQAGNYNVTMLRDTTTDYPYAQNLSAVLNRSGVRVLKNEYNEMVINNRTVIIVGVDDCWAGLSDPPQVPEKDAFVIYLVHEPECRADWNADLVLAGHTHGGQFIPAGFERLASGGLVTLSGEINQGRAVTYITRGIGTSNFDMTLRASRPEIVVINPA
jgi:uncharacterized protein